jgi:hypothetical protein
MLFGRIVNSQDGKNSILFDGNLIIFGMSETDFANSFSDFVKTGSVYICSDIKSNDNSFIRYEAKFKDDKLTEFAIYTHWPNETHLAILEAMVNQFKVTSKEEEEDYTTKYLKKDDIKGYALYAESATLEIWDTRFVKR